MARPKSTGTGERLTVYVPRKLYLRMIRAMADCGTPHRNAWLVQAIESRCTEIELNMLIEGSVSDGTQTTMDEAILSGRNREGI